MAYQIRLPLTIVSLVFVAFAARAQTAEDPDAGLANEPSEANAAVVPATVQDPAKSSDPAIFCAGFAKKTVVVDGQKVQRYVLPQGKYLACIPPQPVVEWTVTKEAWSEKDEKNWQNFIRSLGQSKCDTVDTCLVSSANPYRDQTDIDAVHYSDCADFPMYLRAYFSFKNHLPFSFVSGIHANVLNPDQQQALAAAHDKAVADGSLDKFEKAQGDLRYSINGNRPAGRLGIPAVIPRARDFFSFATTLRNEVDSGTYRMFNVAGPLQPDHYSPRIDKNSIRAGTVLYRVEGHLATVYDVTAQGEVKFLDAHPDNTVSRHSVSNEDVRSTPFQGGGFRNWRPFKIVGLQPGIDGQDSAPLRDENGVIRQAKFKFALDDEISDYSAEQYYGNQPAANWDWKQGKFVVNGLTLKWLDFVTLRMADGNFKLDPVMQFQKDLVDLCGSLQDRTKAVQAGIDMQIDKKDHPENLPNNIYGADGEWESYSSPGRDLVIRSRVLDLIDANKSYVSKWLSHDATFSYKGTNLKKDLIEVYNRNDAACRVSYQNSKGSPVRMSLSTALSRLTKMSFDPYLCPELRWGAHTAAERLSCVESADKDQWYQYTQFLRNQLVRNPTEVMGYSLGDVEKLNQQQALDSSDLSSRFNIQRALQKL